MKKIVDERYANTLAEALENDPDELFGSASGKDSKWRRWRPMTVEIFYVFWAAKLAVSVFG